MTFVYGYGYWISRRAGKGVSVLPIHLVFTAGNVLPLANIHYAPDWFDFAADFTLAFPEGGSVTMQYVSGEWVVGSGEFPDSSGSATLTQGSNSSKATYADAEYAGDFITAAAGDRITAANGIYISWSNP